jgi:hypothetical protein
MNEDRYTAVSNASSEDPHMMFSPEVFAMIGVDLVQKTAAGHLAASIGMSSAGGPSTAGPSFVATEGAASVAESGVSGGGGSAAHDSAPSAASAVATEVPRPEQRAAVRAAVAADPDLIAAAKLLFAAAPGVAADTNANGSAASGASPGATNLGARSGGPHQTSADAEAQIVGVVDTISQQQRMIAHDQREIDLLTLIGRELKDMADHPQDYELDDFGLRALVMTAKASADRIAASSGNSSSSALLASGSLLSPSRKRHAAARDFASSAYSDYSLQSMMRSAPGLSDPSGSGGSLEPGVAAAAVDTTIHRYFSADGVLVSSADTARRHDEIISDARGLYQQQLTVQRRQRRELFKQLTEARSRAEAGVASGSRGASARDAGPDVSVISIGSVTAPTGSRLGSAAAGKPTSIAAAAAAPASATLGAGMSTASALAYPLSRRPLVDLASLARGSSSAESGPTPPEAATSSPKDAGAPPLTSGDLVATTLDLAAPSVMSGDVLSSPSSAGGADAEAPASTKTLKQLLQEQRDLVATAQRRDAGEYQPVLQRLWAYNAAVQDRMDQLLALPLTQQAQRSS